MSAFVRAMAPDAPHPLDRHNIGGGAEAVRAGSERNRAWLRSPDGRAWWAAQKWDRKGDIE